MDVTINIDAVLRSSELNQQVNLVATDAGFTPQENNYGLQSVSVCELLSV